jgi:hypothetical protein
MDLRAAERELLLQLIASITLADNLGDVADDVDTVLKRLGIEVEGDGVDFWEDVRATLGKMNVTTLYGTKIGEV